MATDTDLQALYIKSLYSPQELTLEEVWGISSFLSYRMILLKRAFDSYQDGVIQKDDWDDRARSVPVYLGNDFGRVFWDSLFKPDYANSPGFVSAIDEALATSPVVPDDEWLQDLQRGAQGLGESLSISIELCGSFWPLSDGWHWRSSVGCAHIRDVRV